MPEDDRARVDAIFERVIETGEAEDFEQVYVGARGDRHAFEMRVRAVQGPAIACSAPS